MDTASIGGSDINDNVYKRPKVFKRYEDGYVVREMLPADGRIVQNWYCSMGKISPYDLNVTLSVFPPGAGFYVGEVDGVIVASAIRIPWTDKAAGQQNIFYGSLYFVDEQHRRAGYGTRLRDQVAREYVGDNVLCVDAVQGKVAANNKEKYGYTHGFVLSRYEGVAKETIGDLPKDGTIVKEADVPFDDIISYDNKCFVAPNNPIRRAFLWKWLHVAGGDSYVARDASGHVVGYGQRRPCFQVENHLVGPLYADSPEVANALFERLCSDVAGETVTINIWQPNVAAVSMVEMFGMEKVFDTDRMHVNGDPGEYKDTVFAVTSIDVCGF